MTQPERSTGDLRLLLLSEAFPPPIMGGSEIFAYHLARLVAPSATCVVAPWVDGCEEFDRGEPFETVRLRGMRHSYEMGDIAIVRQTMRLASAAIDAGHRFHPDIVLAAQGYPTSAAGHRVAR